MLDRTMAEFMPSNKTEWEECVLHAHVKNSMIQSYGYTPHQHVFGKNPEVPADLLSEPLHVVPATASLSDDAIARTQAVRTAARKAVVETQDDQALRRAYSARPRLNQQFQPGDLVAYWRCQKYQQGHVILGGQWYGTAVVIGNVGKNYVIAHRKQIFRAAPEQLRHATSEEKTLVTTPNSELLGIKDMIEGGTFRSQQFIDLVPAHYPTMAEPDAATPSTVETDPGVVGSSEASSASEQIDKSPMESGQLTDPLGQTPEEQVMSDDKPSEDSQLTGSRSEAASSSTYGPLRRVHQKNGPPALYRPPAMHADDFAEMMREVVPQLVEEAAQSIDQSMHPK